MHNCDECSALEGVILSVQEAHGVIPVHVQCRCCFLPANVGEDGAGQVRGKAAVDGAFKEAGLDKRISAARPRAVVSPTDNARDVSDEPRDESGRWMSGELNWWRKETQDELAKGVTVYRGTGRGSPNDSGVAGKGEYWSGSREVAQAYGKNIQQGTIALSNPLVLTYPELNALQEHLYGKSLTGFEPDLSARFDRWLRERGHDGVALYDHEISKTVPQEVVRLARRDQTANAFNPAQPRDGQGQWTAGGGSPATPPAPAPTPPAAPAGPPPVHAGSGLQVGHIITKQYRGTTYTVQVTPHGFQVSAGGIPQAVYTSLSAAAQGVRGNTGAVNGWAFFNVPRPAGFVPRPPRAPRPAAPAAAAPAPPPPPPPPPAPVPVHASGLPIGATYTKAYAGGTHTLTVTAAGFQLAHANGTTQTYKSLSAAAAGLRGNSSAVNGWKFFGVPKPGATAPTNAPGPRPAPASANLTSTIPFAAETKWETGDRSGAGTVLNGVPFGSAPPKFWEHTKDVDVNEPKPASKIERALTLVQEPDGRVWIVEPTGHFGGRTHTLPGGTVEPGLTLQQNALKETFEETGLHVEIVKHLGDVEDSNTGRNGRLYLARRVGGAPWDAKIEKNIINPRTGQPAAESEYVRLVTPDRAAALLHRTDDLAMLATAVPIKVDTKPTGNLIKKLVTGLAPAAGQYVARERRAGRHPGSGLLRAVQDLRGFNAKPEVLSKHDMDALVAKGGHIEMLRGVNGHGTHHGRDLTDMFKYGEHFPGYGIFGNGTYADSNKGHRNAASTQYGSGHQGDVVRIALPKTARIIEQSELEKMVPSAPSNFQTNGGGHPANDQWMGIHAALAGYDAIHVDGKSRRQGSYGKGFYVILNRGILTVQKESAKGHLIT